MTSTAYAVSVDGQLNINTIHGHARGAMVNWLHLQGVPMLDRYPEEKIRATFTGMQEFARSARSMDIELVLVTVSVVSAENAATVHLTAPPP